MAERQWPPGSDLEHARRSTDQLAIALEEVGFDVGRQFPALGSKLDRYGRASVELGLVTATVADQLRGVLLDAARCGVTIAAGEG